MGGAGCGWGEGCYGGRIVGFPHFYFAPGYSMQMECGNSGLAGWSDFNKWFEVLGIGIFSESVNGVLAGDFGV